MRESGLGVSGLRFPAEGIVLWAPSHTFKARASQNTCAPNPKDSMHARR